MIGCNQYKRKYEVIEKECPVCNEKFQTKKGAKGEKTTCSYSCSNTFFSKKRNKPENYKRYRTICFKKWPKKCFLCDFDCVIDVHHIDQNHDNNNVSNLIPLCPNHHRMTHMKKWAKEIKQKIEEKLRKVA